MVGKGNRRKLWKDGMERRWNDRQIRGNWRKSKERLSTERKRKAKGREGFEIWFAGSVLVHEGRNLSSSFGMVYVLCPWAPDCLDLSYWAWDKFHQQMSWYSCGLGTLDGGYILFCCTYGPCESKPKSEGNICPKNGISTAKQSTAKQWWQAPLTIRSMPSAGHQVGVLDHIQGQYNVWAEDELVNKSLRNKLGCTDSEMHNCNTTMITMWTVFGLF